MSYDLNLLTTCNHRIYRETVELGSDRRSIRVAQPLASSKIELFASDNKLPGNSYSIIDDPETIEVQRPRMIYLNKKWGSLEDYFEVNYITLSGFCPKCTGFKTIDDLSYDAKGKLFTIRDEKLLLQNMEKFTITRKASNPFHTYIGTSLASLMGSKIYDISYLSTKVTQEINTTLNILKDLQSQYRLSGRAVTSGECLDKIENVHVTQNQQDPTILQADVTATAISGKSVGYTQYLRQRA